MMRPHTFILPLLLMASAALFAKQITVNVSVDTNGHVTVAKRTPPTGTLSWKDHVHWQAENGCHLSDIDIQDHGGPQAWPKVDDHSHSNQADVDVPNKESYGSYKYKIHISCDDGRDGTADYADPELVVSGTKQHHPHKKTDARGGGGDNYPTYKIDVDVNAGTMTDKSPTIEQGQPVHWHAKNGKITAITFDAASDATCDTDCDRDTDDLEQCYIYTYTITAVDKNGTVKNIDPELVISGTCLHGKKHAHARKKKE